MIDQEARAFLRRRLEGERVVATGPVREVIVEWWADCTNGLGGGISDLFDVIGDPARPEQMPDVPAFLAMNRDAGWREWLASILPEPGAGELIGP